jgi:hypothetical protein
MAYAADALRYYEITNDEAYRDLHSALLRPNIF